MSIIDHDVLQELLVESSFFSRHFHVGSRNDHSMLLGVIHLFSLPDTW